MGQWPSWGDPDFRPPAPIYGPPAPPPDNSVPLRPDPRGDVGRPRTGTHSAQILSIIEGSLGSSSIYDWISAFSLFASGRPGDIGSDLWANLHGKLTRAIGGALRIDPGDVRSDTTSLPVLLLYRDVFAGLDNLNAELLKGGAPSPALVDEYNRWQYAIGALGTIAGNGPPSLSSAIGRRMEDSKSAMDYIRTTFAGFGVKFTPPKMPPVPGEIGDQTTGGFNVGSGYGSGGGSRSFTSKTVQEPRVPTAEEFLADFDNAFMTYLGKNVKDLTQDQFYSVQARRNELMGRYIAELGKIAETGESPFIRSTQMGEVTSESSSTDTDAGGSSVTMQRGVDTSLGAGKMATVIAKLSPMDFMTGLFPTIAEMKNFAEGPNPAESRLPNSGFIGSTTFQNSG